MYLFTIKCESPAQSPDLNPIEMVWADMKAFVASRFCRNLDEVKDSIFDYKKTLTPEKCERFINHLKKVIPVVIAKNGGWSNM